MHKILLATICPFGVDIQLALYYLKAYFLKHSLISKSVNIDILPFPFSEKIHSIAEQITKYKPDIVGFSCYVWNVTNILKVSRLIKENTPDVKIVLGGPEASPRAEDLLNNYRFVDAVVIGEGEETFKELIEHWLSNSGKIGQVKGIAYRKKNRAIITEERPQISNLDDIPSPYLEGYLDMDLKSYQDYVPTETMRGCIYKCHYCYYHKEMEGIRYFSLARVERELGYLLGKRPKGIYLMDATFNMNRERAKEVLRIFARYNEKTNLHVELKAEFLDKEMVSLLQRAKANFIEIGLQSTNKKTLKLINRTFNPPLFKKNILLLNKKKIPYELQLIDGLPGDNYKTLKTSLNWLFMLRPFRIKIMRFMLLPGTYLRWQARKFQIKYSRRPPYYSSKSNTFYFKDLKKTQKLRIAISMCYETGLFRNSLHLINKRLGIEFADIFEAWNSWMRKEHNGIMRIMEGNSDKDRRIGPLIKQMAVMRTANLSIGFAEFLHKKYNKPFRDKKLLEFLKRDRRAFLGSMVIIEERV